MRYAKLEASKNMRYAKLKANVLVYEDGYNEGI
jgi:hypothetical protein